MKYSDNVNANFDALQNVTSGNVPHQRYLQAKVKDYNVPKQVKSKSHKLSRSQEIELIWTVNYEFPTISNKTLLVCTLGDKLWT